MEVVYYYIGLIVFNLFGFLCCLIVTAFMFKWIFDKLGNIFKNWWVIVDYAYYKKDFKEFMKDKKSIIPKKYRK